MEVLWGGVWVDGCGKWFDLVFMNICVLLFLLVALFALKNVVMVMVVVVIFIVVIMW